MWILKGLYFFGSAAFAAQYLYTALFYFQYFQLTKEEIGLIAALNPFVSLIAIPTTIHYSKNLKKTALICVLFGMMAWSLHWFVPQKQPDRYDTVLWLLGITLTTSMTMSSLGTILDSLTLELLADKSLYGQQRLFGSISWGLSSFITGLGMQWKGIWVPFYIFFGFISVFFVLLCFVPRPVGRDDTSEVTETPDSSYGATTSNEVNNAISGDTNDADSTSEEHVNIPVDEATSLLGRITVWQALGTPKSFFFFLSISLLGLVFAVLGLYLFIYLSTTWQASPTLLGLTTPFSIACEVPTFYYSGYLIKKLGRTRMIVISHVLMFLRMALYIFLPALLPTSMSWVMAIVEMLHGASYGLQWSAGMSFLELLAPSYLQQTFVGIFASLSNNAGGILGNVIGGIVYERFGYVGLWSVCSLILGISLLSFLIAIKCK
jgi:PPP family 3-phenylpropionic acid transporter